MKMYRHVVLSANNSKRTSQTVAVAVYLSNTRMMKDDTAGKRAYGDVSEWGTEVCAADGGQALEKVNQPVRK
jgi:hypothetical protein